MNSLQKDFYREITGLAWSLWDELGVSGTIRFHENCLIQLEELIILTALISDFDPRLRDEALDWCSQYHEFISISRLKSLLKETNEKVLNLFSQFSAALNSLSSANWPFAASELKFKIKRSGKSLLPSLSTPSLLNLRLRSLFGPSAKADVLTLFLSKNGIRYSGSDLVEIGYSKRALITALDQLASSGIINSANVRNKKIYELNRPKELQLVIGKLPKVAPPWNNIIQFILSLDSIIDDIVKSSPSTREVILRDCLRKNEHLLPFISQILNNNEGFKKDWDGVITLLNSFQKGNFFNMYEIHDEFEKIIIGIMSNLYRVDDSLDGIETIETEKSLNPQKHARVYKETYQLFLSFIKDLEVNLEQFLDFPFYKAMDEQLSDIPYRFSKEKLPHLLQEIKKIKPLDLITAPQVAVQQYYKITPYLINVRQFLNTFRKRLSDLYFVKTNIYLLTLPDTLYKRHIVLKLYSEDV